MQDIVPVLSLWLPIVVSAVFVFFVSFILHSVLPYHKSDFRPVPEETRFMDTVRPFGLTPGEYAVPFIAGQEAARSPECVDKLNKGPVMHMTVMPNGMFSMGKSLGIWFVYCLVIGVFAAYVSGRALGPGASYLEVFRFAGTAAFLGYTTALWQDSIWFAKPWSTTVKNTLDGLVYALFTAGTFGWLWPEMM